MRIISDTVQVYEVKPKIHASGLNSDTFKLKKKIVQGLKIDIYQQITELQFFESKGDFLVFDHPPKMCWFTKPAHFW